MGQKVTNPGIRRKSGCLWDSLIYACTMNNQAFIWEFADNYDKTLFYVMIGFKNTPFSYNFSHEIKIIKKIANFHKYGTVLASRKVGERRVK